MNLKTQNTPFVKAASFDVDTEYVPQVFLIFTYDCLKFKAFSNILLQTKYVKMI